MKIQAVEACDVKVVTEAVDATVEKVQCIFWR
jgi:hypothetical protein